MGKHVFRNPHIFGMIIAGVFCLLFGQGVEAAGLEPSQAGRSVGDVAGSGPAWTGMVRILIWFGLTSLVAGIYGRLSVRKYKKVQSRFEHRLADQAAQLDQANQRLEKKDRVQKETEEKLFVSKKELDHYLYLRNRQMQCLGCISDLANIPGITLEGVFQKTVKALAKSWSKEGPVSVSVLFAHETYQSENFQRSPFHLCCDIYCYSNKMGCMEVHYNNGEHCESDFMDLGLRVWSQEQELLGEIGEKLGLVATRKMADENLQATNEFLEQVMESISSVIFVIDLEEKVNLVSKAISRASGYRVDEVVGRPFGFLFPLEKHEEIHEKLKGVRRTGMPVNQYEIQLTNKGGEELVWMLNLVPLYEEGELIGIVATAEDIIQSKRLQHQLLQAQKLESIGQLASGIAHEINTPIQYVGDNTRFFQDGFRDIRDLIRKQKRLIEDGGAEGSYERLVEEINSCFQGCDIDYLLEEVPKAIEQTLEGIDRVSQIVRSMKEFSHPGVEGKVAVDLNRVIESTITISRNEWKYVAELELDLDPELGMVACLPNEFNQVILNVLINAAQAIGEVVKDREGEKGVIRVQTRDQGDWVEIRIIDTGSGIGQKIQSKVFDPFFTTKKVGVGSGQGLAISHNIIVDKHQGMITFESEAGQGTTFIIRLPKTDSQGHAVNDEATHSICR